MAIDTTSQVLFDSPIRVVMQFTGYTNDGTAETETLKVDSSELEPVPTNLKVTGVKYDVKGGAVKLAWDGTPDEAFLIATGQNDSDYMPFGGIANNADFPTQGITFSTLNFAPGSSYSITLEMRKS